MTCLKRLQATLLAAVVAASGHGGAFAQDGDPVDASSLGPDAAMNRLEQKGYTELRSVDRDAFDNEIELEGLNPEGERVRVTVDTTIGSVLYEHSLSRSE